MTNSAHVTSQAVIAEVRRILEERWPAEETIRAIRRLLDPPVDRQPIQRTGRGWPVLRASTWQRQDDLETPR